MSALHGRLCAALFVESYLRSRHTRIRQEPQQLIHLQSQSKACDARDARGVVSED